MEGSGGKRRVELMWEEGGSRGVGGGYWRLELEVWVEGRDGWNWCGWRVVKGGTGVGGGTSWWGPVGGWREVGGGGVDDHFSLFLSLMSMTLITEESFLRDPALNDT